MKATHPKEISEVAEARRRFAADGSNQTKVVRSFHFESAHRLPWYQGACAHLHGHSYTMWVELKGEPDERGMLIDFRHLKQFIQPLIDQWDHATLVAESDVELLQVVRRHEWRHFVLPYDSTAENLWRFAAQFFSDECSTLLPMKRMQGVEISLRETRNSTASFAVNF